jgi:hypothetical protein
VWSFEGIKPKRKVVTNMKSESKMTSSLESISC